jgi:hypothetical protein
LSSRRHRRPRPRHLPFRLRPIRRQGTASAIPEGWTRFAPLDQARQAVKTMYHDDRVLRVFIVTDDAPQRFVEWVERCVACRWCGAPPVND